MAADKDVEKGYPVRSNIFNKFTATRTPYNIYVTSFDDIYNHQYRGEGTLDKPYIVDWLPHDPENPQNWRDAYKWLLAVFASVATLAITFCSSAYVGEVDGLLQEFGGSIEVVTLGISLFVLGYVIGIFTFLFCN